MIHLCTDSGYDGSKGNPGATFQVALLSHFTTPISNYSRIQKCLWALDFLQSFMIFWACLGPEKAPKREIIIITRKILTNSTGPPTVLCLGPNNKEAPSLLCSCPGAVVAVVGAPLALAAAGFTSAGIAAGSLAASAMSVSAVANGGGVIAGGAVAVCQSIGKQYMVHFSLNCVLGWITFTF